jgi:putative methyltransferase (TIGR04325 family)
LGRKNFPPKKIWHTVPGIMMMKIKDVLKLFVPPIIGKIISFNRKGFEFRETSLDWKEIVKETKGYEADSILNKCKNALLKVKNGEYPYERDSVLFDTLQIFYPLLSALFYVALQYNSEINLIDFGGSLGSTYYQNRGLLKKGKIKFSWNVIEQGHFVKCGKEYFETDELKFMINIEEATKSKKINLCLLSGVLQYLETPYTTIEKIFDSNIEYIIIDRTTFTSNNKDILTIQTVHKDIYEAKYPAWFFSLDVFQKYLERKYEIIYSWESFDAVNLEGYKVFSLGYLLKRA